MERPTSALHLTRVTLSLRQLGAEPHTKEVGHERVYNHRGLRSACRVSGGGGVVAWATNAVAPAARRRFADDRAVCGAARAPGCGALLLRGRSLRLRVAAIPDGP